MFVPQTRTKLAEELVNNVIRRTFRKYEQERKDYLETGEFPKLGERESEYSWAFRSPIGAIQQIEPAFEAEPWSIASKLFCCGPTIDGSLFGCGFDSKYIRFTNENGPLFERMAFNRGCDLVIAETTVTEYDNGDTCTDEKVSFYVKMDDDVKEKFEELKELHQEVVEVYKNRTKDYWKQP